MNNLFLVWKQIVRNPRALGTVIPSSLYMTTRLVVARNIVLDQKNVMWTMFLLWRCYFNRCFDSAYRTRIAGRVVSLGDLPVADSLRTLQLLSPLI